MDERRLHSGAIIALTGGLCASGMLQYQRKGNTAGDYDLSLDSSVRSSSDADEQPRTYERNEYTYMTYMGVVGYVIRMACETKDTFTMTTP